MKIEQINENDTIPQIVKIPPELKYPSTTNLIGNLIED